MRLRDIPGLFENVVSGGVVLRLSSATAHLRRGWPFRPTLAMGWRVRSGALELEEVLLPWKELEPLALATEKSPTPWPRQPLHRCP